MLKPTQLILNCPNLFPSLRQRFDVHDRRGPGCDGARTQDIIIVISSTARVCKAPLRISGTWSPRRVTGDCRFHGISWFLMNDAAKPTSILYIPAKRAKKVSYTGRTNARLPNDDDDVVSHERVLQRHGNHDNVIVAPTRPPILSISTNHQTTLSKKLKLSPLLLPFLRTITASIALLATNIKGFNKPRSCHGMACLRRFFFSRHFPSQWLAGWP